MYVMPVYVYEGIDTGGRTIRGRVEEGSLSGAGAELRRRGLMITSLTETGGPDVDGSIPEPPDLNLILTKLSRVKKSDVFFLLRQLASLIKAGVSIVLSLSILEKQTPSRRMKYILSSVRREVEAGNPLSDAMGQFPAVFPPMVTNIIKTGEVSGLLDVAIERIAIYWEEKLALRQQIITSVIYPVIVLLVSTGIVFFIISYVIPTISGFLETMGGELPWTTQLLLFIGNNVSSRLFEIVSGMVILVSAVAGALLLPAGRYFIHRHMLRLPLLGAVFQYSNIVFFAKTLSMLINSGVSIVEGLKSTRDSIGNTAVKKIIDVMIERVLAGENLSSPILKEGGIFPPMVGTMVKVGEETGGIDSSLSMVADIYAKLLESRIKRMVNLIEPVLLIVIGGIVAFIAVSLVGAILSSYGTVPGG